MKYKIVLILMLSLTYLGSTSTLRAGAMEDKFKKKQAAPFVKNGGWILDFTEARKKAIKENKPIFAYFTRSYAP
jgi:hypothetical protein